MNTNAILKAVAVYAEWFYRPTIWPGSILIDPWQAPDGSYHKNPPAYTTSYSAIIPLIQQLKDEDTYSSNPEDYPTIAFTAYLTAELGAEPENESYGWQLYRATPLQLCVALLKATKNWKEEYESD